MKRRSLVLLLAIASDLAFGELPNRWHPVAWLGKGIERCERAMSGQRPVLAGLALAAAFPAAAWFAARGVQRIARRAGFAGVVGEALLLKQTFSIRALFEHAARVQQHLEARDLDGARAVAGMMVSRDTVCLDEPALASAAIESMSENASDSVIAPWTWFAVGGVPAAAAYRAINTLDAMVGYRSKGWVGTPSARLDDLANYVPARLTAALYAAVSGGRQVIDKARAGHAATPSPNSGWPMAAAAHALGVRLEKAGHHVLNPGARVPDAGDIAAAQNLTCKALAGGALVALIASALRPDGSGA